MKDKKTVQAASAATDETEYNIKLKPILGIHPGMYLTVIYSMILLAIFFFLLIYPGIKNPVAALIVKTEPKGAAIRVNDVYMGISGGKIIVPGGTSVIEAVMPGFESASAVREIPGSVFGSLFFPRSYKIEFVLKPAGAAAALANYAADYAAWSFGGEPTEAWQIPMSLSEGAYRIGREQEAGNREELQRILAASSRFTVTRAALRDLIRAKLLLDNYGNSPSPAAVIGSISDVLGFLSENPGSAFWLSRLLPAENASALRTSAWAGNEYDTETEFFPDFDQPQRMARFTLSGLNFTYMGAGRLLSRGIASAHRPLGRSVYLNSFYVSDNPVPRSLFETFLSEKPEWREHFTEFYSDEIAFHPDTHPANVITGITWLASDAFCKWLTERLPPSMANMEIRLPTEDEWEYASLSITNMQNPGWEWCADPYAPLNFIKAQNEAIQAVGSPERSIRGRTSALSAETRASLPPDFSSPYVTFRPVIAERR